MRVDVYRTLIKKIRQVENMRTTIEYTDASNTDKNSGDADEVVDVDLVIDQAGVTQMQLCVVGWCGLVAILDGVNTQIIGVVSPVLAKDWNVALSDFGSVFATGLLGLMFGAVIFGPLGDKFGRKTTIIWMTASFGLLSVLSAHVSSMAELMVVRFLIGLGLGGVMPSILALTSEYSPKSVRATLITIMFCGIPLGAALGAIAGSLLIPRFGWESVFYVSGVATCVVAIGAALFLPESLSYLVSKGERSTPHIAGILARFTATSTYSRGTRFVVSKEVTTGRRFVDLLKAGQWPSTALIWLCFFMNLLLVYVLVSWLPSLLSRSGVPLEQAIYALAALNLGGVAGGVLIGRVIDKVGPYTTVAGFYIIAGFSISYAGWVQNNAVLFYIVIFILGFGALGAQLGINAVAANLYPTSVRSTGLGWAWGIGRFGSAVGSLAGGVVLAWGWSTPLILTTFSTAAFISAAAVLLLGRLSQLSKHQRETAHVIE